MALPFQILYVIIVIWCYLSKYYVTIVIWRYLLFDSRYYMISCYGGTFPDIICYNSDVVLPFTWVQILYVIIVIWCYLSRYYICYNSDMVLPFTWPQILYDIMLWCYLP